MYSIADSRSGARRVALVTLDILDHEALGYGLNACQRMDARLDVLTNIALGEVHRTIIRLGRTMDIPWRVIQIGAEGGDEVFRYAGSESGLLFLVSSACDLKARWLRERSGPEGLRLIIPWVVVKRRQYLPVTQSTEQ